MAPAQKIHTPDGKPMLSARKAALRLRCAPDYIGKLCREGKLRGQLIDKAWFVEADSLSEFEAARQATRAARAEELSRERKEELTQNGFVPKAPAVAAPAAVVATTSAFAYALKVAVACAAAGALVASSAVVTRSLTPKTQTAAVAHIDSPFFGASAPASTTSVIGKFFASLFAPTPTQVATAPEAQPTQPTATTTPPAPVQQTIVQNTYPVIQRTIEHTVTVADPNAVSTSELATRLQEVENSLTAKIFAISSQVSGNAVIQYAPAQRIDKLNNVTITNSTIDGYVASGSTIAAANGGTGLTSYTAGDLLYATGAGTLARLPIGTTGQILKVSGGLPVWGVNTGGGGAGAWATTTDGLAVYPADPTQVVLIGASATTTTGNIFEVTGNALFNNGLKASFATTTNLLALGSTTLQNVTALNATTSNATTTSLFATTASSTNLFAQAAQVGSLTIGNLSGFLKATAGAISTSLVSLTSDVSGVLGIANGGTGTSTAPAYGQVLVGNSAGGYDLVATSSLGIVSGGNGAAFPFVATSNYGAATNATSTPVWFQAGLQASSTSHLVNFDFALATGTNATTTNFFADTASSTNLFAAAATVGSLSGAGLTTCNSTTQKLLWANGTFSCGTDLNTGGAGGTDVNWTFFNGSGLYVSTSTNQVLIGAASTSTLAKLEVHGGAVIDNATTTNATTTNLFATTASSTNLFAQAAQVGSLTINGLSGFLKATAGAISTAAVNLASDVTGILPVANGGTGWSTFASNTLLTGNGSGALATTTVGTGLSLSGGTLSNSGVLSIAQSSGSAQTGAITLATSTVAANGITLGTAITNTSGTFTFVPTISGTLNNSGLTNSTVALADSNSTLTIGGSPISLGGSGSITLNLAHGNVWTAASTTFAGGLTALTATTTSATSTNFFATTASSTNLFAQSASFGSLALGTPLTVPNGGTGAGSFASGQLLYGAGTGALQSVATSSLAVGSSLSVSGTLGSQIGGSNSTISLNTANANNWSALQTFQNASSTLLSVFTQAYFGATATTTIDSLGNVAVAGNLTVAGNSTTTNATTTTSFATTASSTNLFAAAAQLGTLTVANALNAGFSTLAGFISTASSTINGNLTVTGNSTTTNATTTNFFATTASSTNLFATSANVGSLVGAGLATCNTTTDKLLWNGGTFSCGTDAGSVGTTEINWQYFNNSGVRLGTTSNQVLIGASATSTKGSLEVAGGSIEHYASGNPLLAGSVTSSNLVYQTAIAGRYAYSVEFGGGLRILDISNPKSPTFAGSYTGITNALSVAVSGKYAYVGDSATGLNIIDVSSPSTTVKVGGYSFPEINASMGMYGIAASGRYVYVTDYDHGSVYIVDVTDPTAPKWVGTYKITGGAPYALAVSGKYLYVGDQGTARIYVVDVSNPGAPATVGSYTSSGIIPSSLYVSGKYLYVGDQTKGFYILDVSKPTNILLAGQYKPDLSDAYYGVSVAGNYAYVADHTNKLALVLDVSNPASPSLVGSYSIGSGAPMQVSLIGKYAYVADYNGGIQIIDINGLNTPAATIGSLAATQANVSDSLAVGGDITAGGGLDVGIGGILSRGTIAAAIASTTQGYTSSSTPTVASFIGGNVGIGTTSPYARLTIHAGAGETAPTLFAISSSTAAFATSTLFAIDNRGLVTATNLLLTGSTTLQNFTALNATTSNATTTNLFATTASSTNLFATTFSGGAATLSGTLGVTGLGTLGNLLVTGSSTLQNFTSLNATTSNATTTALAISSIASSLLKTTSSGSVVAAVANVDYATPGAVTGFHDWQITNGYLTPTTTLGVLVNASSTIGNGTQAGGLTISGGATTTGNMLTLGSTTLQNVTALNATTSSATTTSLFATTASSTNLFAQAAQVGSLTINGLSGFLKATAGAISTAAVNLASDVTGILPVANGGTGWSTFASNTLLTGNGSGALATTTVGTGLSLSGGTLSNSGVLSIAQSSGSAQTGAITLATSTLTRNGQTLGLAITNTGGTFTLTPTLSGTLDNAGLTNSTISGVALGGTLANLSATDSTLTFSGSYNGSTARTVGLNLGNANTWTALQSFSNASTSLLSVTGTAYFGGTATTTIDSLGNININQFAALQQGGVNILYASTTTHSLQLGQNAGNTTNVNAAYNTLVGYDAGTNITSGANNLILGSWSTAANANITSGSNNIILGYNIKAPSATNNSQLDIGNILYGTNVDGSASTISTGQIGIGSTTPNARLAVQLNAGDTNTNAFTIGSSTGTFATSTLFNIDNTGLVTAKNILATGSTTLQNVTALNATTSSATTTNLFATTASSTNLFSQAAAVGGLTLNGANGALSASNGTVSAGTLSVGNGGTGATSFTAGSLIFSNGTTLAQDNAALFYDNTNHRLGIGTTTPWASLSINAGSASTTFAIGSSTSTYFVVNSAGNVGIGTSTPWTKLGLTQGVTSGQVDIAFDNADHTILSTNATGQYIVVPSGNSQILPNSNLWVCTGGTVSTNACPTGTPSGQGNLVVANRLGIGTTTLGVSGANYKLAIETQDSTSNFINIASSTSNWSQTTSIFTIGANGRVGIGTSTPFVKLSVGAGGAITTVENNNGNISSSLTVDWSAGNQQRLVLTGNPTISFTNYVAGQILRLVVCQDSTGSRSVTWSGPVAWQGAAAPTLTTTPNYCDLIAFVATYATSTNLVIMGSAALNFP